MALQHHLHIITPGFSRVACEIIFHTAVPDPQYILPIRLELFHHLGISSDGINAIVTHFIIATKKKSARGFELTPWEQAV